MDSNVKRSLTLTRRTFTQSFATGAVGLWIAGPNVLRAESVFSPGKELIVHSDDPPNAEPSLDKLVASPLTPLNHFYVRSHGTTPKIDTASFRLSVEGLVEKSLQLSLEQLTEQFRKRTVEATLTCAGNRRNEHSLIKPVSGVPWGAGAIGNATWGGAVLSEILKKAGIKDGAQHVWFEGVDEIQHGGEIIGFGGSIPLDKALADTGTMPGALVAYEMNDQPLLPDHGFPMRTVVPGYIGARSVKWLGKIVVSDRPSPNHYLQDAYKIITTDDPQQLAAADPVYEFPINAATCTPAANAKLKSGELLVQGYALPPGLPGRTIAQVELSTDGGKTWSSAKFTTPTKPFCWRLWQAKLAVSPQTTQLIVRTVDSAGEMQPANVDWNLKGYLFNAWHRTPIQVAS